MNNTPKTPESRPEAPAPRPEAPPRPDGPDTPLRPDPLRARRTPSPRMTAALAAGMLALGVVVGAAIGPAPTPSFALGRLLPLLPSILRSSEPTSTRAPTTTAQATPSDEEEAASTTRRHRRRKHKKAVTEAETSSSSEAATGEATTPSTTPTSTGPAKTKAVKLPPVTKVWLIELANSSFAEASAHASAAPYLETTALPLGTLASEWSSLEASTLANDAALIAGSSPQLLDTIVQPPCPEGAAGATCEPDTPGALTTADEFLKATLPTITSTTAYKENGLVVVTFASISNGTASGLPAGAATATLTSKPPAGALLISPFVAAGARSTTPLNPTSPQLSLEKLLLR
jgi:hypothetical protein